LKQKKRRQSEGSVIEKLQGLLLSDEERRGMDKEEFETLVAVLRGRLFKIE